MANDGIPTFDAMDVVKSVQAYKARESTLMKGLQSQLIAVQQSGLSEIEQAAKFQELIESAMATLKNDDPMVDACKQCGIPIDRLYP